MSNEVTASLTKHRRTTLERVEKFISREFFTDVNLFGRLYSARLPLQHILHWDATASQKSILNDSSEESGDGPEWKVDVPSREHFKEYKPGELFGPTWSTHWFILAISIPPEWIGKEVHLLWDSGSEAMLWKAGAKTPLQAFSGGVGHQMRDFYVLSRKLTSKEAWEITRETTTRLWVEVACNDLFGAGAGGMINPPDPNKMFSVKKAEIAVFDREVFDLAVDFEILYGMAKSLPEGDPKANDALYLANHVINILRKPSVKTLKDSHSSTSVVVKMDLLSLQCKPDRVFHEGFGLQEFRQGKIFGVWCRMQRDRFTVSCFQTEEYAKISDVRKLTKQFFSAKNGDRQHKIFALGHCHIDCAWLWTYDETIRKCGRSWITMIRLMEEFPDFRFVASSAQQFAWVKQYYPTVYEEIKNYVKKGQFIPVGGTWVEMDGNLPSGEAFIRQFLYGQDYFLKEFGARCDIFWLPDTFGYSAQLPQIMKLAGIKYFVTQKLSWSLVNQFPHHNFIWRGIDGSEVLVHFPPGDSYGMELTVEDTLKTVEKLKDKGRVHQSVLLYGYGDGGGGPTPAMIERGLRMKDVDGLPKVVLNESISDFFRALEKEKRNLNTWSGELYLELHNGTYTTQAALKRNNRMVQNLFRDAEFLDAVLYGFFGIEPVDRREQWQDFLLQQFHDVLPGSSIEAVYVDANRILTGLIDALNETCVSALEYLFPTGQPLLNATAATLRYEAMDPKGHTVLRNLTPYSLASASSLPWSADVVPTEIIPKYDGFIMRNGDVEIVLDRFAGVVSMVLKAPTGSGKSDRECIAPGGAANRLVMFDDIPLYWDAWDCMDYHLEARTTCYTFLSIETTPSSVIFSCKPSPHCTVIQRISLQPNSPVVLVDLTVDWHESHKFLKMEVDVNVTSENKKATYEIQHGWVERPAHRNTSWDWAKFEVCCQRWADLSEHGFGVAVINLGSHGFSVRDGKMALSLLRSPKAPDANADMGGHALKYAIMPHWGSFQEAGVITTAIALNDTWNPSLEQELPGLTENVHILSSGVHQIFHIGNPAVILDAVKVAENRDVRAIVIRLYESHGGVAETVLTTRFPVVAYRECNILEDPIGDKVKVETGVTRISLRLTAFEIKSYILYLAKDAPSRLL